MRSLPIVLLLAAMTAGQSGGKAPRLPRLTLPVASNGTPDDATAERAIVSVDAKGRVTCRGKRVTLEQLGVILRNLCWGYELVSTKEGKVCRKIPRPSILLCADKETPWQHVQWLLAILAERGFGKVQFAVTRVADRAYAKQEAARLGVEWIDRAPSRKPQPEAKLDAFLSVDRGEPPASEIKALVHILARQEILAKWGGNRTPVTKPTVFKYRMGDRTCDSLELVDKWIGDARKAAQGAPGTRVIGEIKASYKVPFKHVVAVLNQFHGRGVTRVAFWGTAGPGEKEHSWNTTIPDKQLRRRTYLPYPIKHYPTK